MKTAVYISEVRDAGEFYVVYENNPKVKEIDTIVDAFDATNFTRLRVVKKHTLCVVLSAEDNKYYRGKVLSGFNKEGQADVELIDYGCTEKVTVDKLF